MLGAISWSEILTIVFFSLMVIGAGFAAMGKLLLWMIAKRVADVEDGVMRNEAKAEGLGRELVEFKLKAAEQYATHMAVADAERNMAEAIRGIYTRLDGAVDRLDARFNSTNVRLDNILLAMPAQTAEPAAKPRRGG